MEESVYYRQAKLLLRVLPIIARYPVFALKGGTAINFFIRDMPRLSVDIDLTYTVVDDRATALSTISTALSGIGNDIQHLLYKATVIPKKSQGNITSLIVQADGTIVKVEPNLVVRGTIFEPVTLLLNRRAQEAFGVSLKTSVLATAEVYGGKICAALDRQHPRDLFDVKLLFENEGITDSIRKSFIVHLISHDRPMVELLNPNFQGLQETVKNEFEGMTYTKISLEELEAARAELVKAIGQKLTDTERQFILSVKKGSPRWELLELEGIGKLPAVQWKLMNISRMDKKKHMAALRKLEKCLSR
jgi:hypothetical protein